MRLRLLLNGTQLGPALVLRADGRIVRALPPGATGGALRAAARHLARPQLRGAVQRGAARERVRDGRVLRERRLRGLHSPPRSTAPAVIRFIVSVPVLSLQMVVALPIVSQAASTRIRFMSCSIFVVLYARDRHRERRPSGTATTTIVTAMMKASGSCSAPATSAPGSREAASRRRR